MLRLAHLFRWAYFCEIATQVVADAYRQNCDIAIIVSANMEEESL